MTIIPPSGPEGAEQLNKTNPCQMAWCTATACSWEPDDIDGSLYRLHARLDEASGVELTQYEYAPGDSRSAEPGIYVRNGWAGDLTVAEALAARTAMDQMLTALAPTVRLGALMSAPAPRWAPENDIDYEAGDVEYNRYSSPERGVTAWLQQVDYLDVVAGVVQLIRKPATIRFTFDNAGTFETPTYVEEWDSQPIPLDEFVNGHRPTFPDRISASRVALALDAGAELARVAQ